MKSLQDSLQDEIHSKSLRSSKESGRDLHQTRRDFLPDPMKEFLPLIKTMDNRDEKGESSFVELAHSRRIQEQRK
jgi:hypothetical protein